MPQAKNTSMMNNPGIMMFTSFLGMTVINAIVLFVANMWMPMNVVLGNVSLSATWAIILAATAIGLIGTFAMPFINEAEKLVGRPWSSIEWMVMYLIINFVSIWSITRVSEVFGMGVTSWLVVLVLAIVMDLLQGVYMMTMQKLDTK